MDINDGWASMAHPVHYLWIVVEYVLSILKDIPPIGICTVYFKFGLVYLLLTSDECHLQGYISQNSVCLNITSQVCFIKGILLTTHFHPRTSYSVNKELMHFLNYLKIAQNKKMNVWTIAVCIDTQGARHKSTFISGLIQHYLYYISQLTGWLMHAVISNTILIQEI